MKFERLHEILCGYSAAIPAKEITPEDSGTIFKGSQEASYSALGCFLLFQPQGSSL